MNLNEKEINLIGFEFVNKIQILYDATGEKVKSTTRSGSFAHLPSTDLTDILAQTTLFHHKYSEKLNDYVITASANKKTYGFAEKVYIDFYKFIYKISLFNTIDNKVSLDFLKKKTFNWIVNVFIENKADKDLVNYLKDNLEEEVRNISYYYPIHNVTLFNPIKIGIAEFTYFTKEYFEQYYLEKKSKYKSKKEFDSIFQRFQGRIFVKINLLAESNKGEEVSYEMAKLAVDVLKIFSPTIHYPEKECGVELEKRLAFGSEHLEMDINKEYDFKICRQANHNQVPITKDSYNSLKEGFLDNFAKILQWEKKLPIDITISNSVKFYSKAISENDLHLRIAYLIMILESMFLLEEEEHKLEKKCRRRMCKLLFPDGGKEAQKLNEALTELYKIRHKMIHKSIRKYIELKHLRSVQTSLVDTMSLILKHNHLFKRKEELIPYLDRDIK